MFKKIFLFIATILAATSASTGYGAPDFLKGEVNVTTFLDWFNNAHKYVHVNGLIVLDLIPAIFLIIQAGLFFKEGLKIKGILTVLALLVNLIGVFLLVQFAYPIASQIVSWTPDNLPSEWISIKDEWFKFHGLYGLMGVVGWLFFVITYFVPARNTGVKKLPRVLNFFKNAVLFFLTFIMGMGVAGLYEYCFLPFHQEISGVTFIEMHRPLDLAIRAVGPYLFAFIVFLQLLLATLLFMEKSKHKVWLIILSLVFLLCDTFIALTYNRPLNDLFLTWTPTSIPANWSVLRDEWLNYHFYRNIFKALGAAAILLVFFTQKDKREPQPL